MDIEKLVNEANRVMAGWYQELNEKSRSGLFACCAKGDQVQLEIGINPSPFDRQISIAVTITNRETGERQTISKAVIETEPSH